MIKINKYVSSFTLRLGPIVSNGSLMSVQKPKPKGFKLVSPDGKSVRQVYVPSDSDGPIFNYDQLQKAYEEEEKNIIVNKENIEMAKKSSLPLNVLNMTVHNANEVNEQLFSSDNNAYVFEPDAKDPANIQWYVTLLELLNSSNKAFIGMCNLKNHEGLFRVSTWRNRLIIQKQLYPESINNHKKYDTDYTINNETLQKGLSIINKLTIDFNAEEYKNSIQEKIESIKVIDQNNENILLESKSPNSDIDIFAALDAFEDI